MPAVHIRDILAPARDERRGIAAFNVIGLEHAEGIVAGAEAAGRPVILQLSQNAVAHRRGTLRPVAAALVALAGEAAVPVALHLDHAEDPALLRAAAAAGFSSVMFDASSAADEDNVAATADAAAWARGAGVWLEGELGEVGGKDGDHTVGAGTDPDAAADYVRRTRVDALAVAVGSSHKMTDRTARLDRERIAALRAAVPVPLVLHGSSGVPDDELRAAVAAGMVKVNVGTLLNVAFTGAVRGTLAERPELVDPRPYLAAGRDAIAEAAERVARTLAGA
ncbi:class II fructose-bisphosphate aldolase [Patulibacter sp. SYSU D01012]|uniref:class II fructose-bisphosphate aldolase n=1 Tax=Patulibacter sp. SYSU D01012 TaxID=2817381 RepID=UPI001B307118|nr:class II fructose-bisphosphate aldolase [Patulibacter sp. SYSU D01012]